MVPTFLTLKISIFVCAQKELKFVLKAAGSPEVNDKKKKKWSESTNVFYKIKNHFYVLENVS